MRLIILRRLVVAVVVAGASALFRVEPAPSPGRRTVFWRSAKARDAPPVSSALSSSSFSSSSGGVALPLEFWRRHRARVVWVLRSAIFSVAAASAVRAVNADRWTALRVSSAGTKHSTETQMIQRRKRADMLTQLTGVGYTPRIVALVGLMLRSLQFSARGVARVFDPPVGFAAGATLAARYSHREWLSCLMVGWYFGGWFWRVLGVAPPPAFDGVPILVRQIRFVPPNDDDDPPGAQKRKPRR